MIIRQHQFGTNARCLYCGAEEFSRVQEYHRQRGREVPETDGRQCLPREVWPEPKRREIACEDGGTISSRLAELQKQRTEALNHADPDA